MQIEQTHHIDASEPDESGMYEYYYEYDIYRFKDTSICFVARSYADEPDEAHFLSAETNGNSRFLERSDLKHPLFLSALSHLRSRGKVHIRWFSRKGNGYEALPENM
ncbi:MAG: hypothetical protein LBE24_00335 [Methylobacillus sp.]|jgi:hypothetical protein|nr:hypothetical protein [Methylobacillus sp.]